MIAYSVIMFAVSVLFFGLGAAIYRGNTNLIHAYHQTHVSETEKRNYGKSFSKGLFIVAVSLVFSGIIALLGTTVPVVISAVGLLCAGMIIAFIVIARVQKEFNGGLF